MDNDGSSPMMMMMMMDEQQPQQQPQQYSASQPQPITTSAEEFYEEEEEKFYEEEEEDYEQYEDDEESESESESEEEEEEEEEAKRAKKIEAIVARKQEEEAAVEEEEVGSLWIGDLEHWMDEEEKEDVRKLWIGNLQHWMDENYIHTCFAHTGEVFTSKVIRNKKTKECYGFILFKSHAIAERFLHKFNDTPMPKVVGSNFRLNWASSFGPGEEEEEEEEEDDMLEQETLFASVKVDGATTTKIPKMIVGDGAPAPQLTKGMCYLNEGVLDRLTLETMNKGGGGSNSSWDIMLKWWKWAQADETSTPQTLEASQRVYEIVALLKMNPEFWKVNGVTSVNKEELLDELQGYVELIDVAKELHSVGGLDHILSYLYSNNAGIRAMVAKLIGIMEHNNHSSEQLVMKAGGLDLLFRNFFSECDETVMTNTVDAISVLFRKNGPTFTAFREEGGYANLDYGLRTISCEMQMRTLNLIRCLVKEHNLDCSVVTVLGFHRLMMNLASSVYSKVQNTALECLLVLVEVEGGGNSDQKVKNDEQLKQVLQELIERSSEDLGAAMVERRLVDLLWNACYNEPYSLREGLLVLP